jgi:hypothetical protein
VPVTRWDPTPYPDARKNRTPPVGLVDDSYEAPIHAPRTRLWAINMQETNQGEYGRVVSGRYLGPLIVKRIVGTMVQTFTAASRVPGLAIYYQNVPYPASQHHVISVPLAGTSIFDTWSLLRDDGGSGLGLQGIVKSPGNTNFDAFDYPLDFIINEREVYFAVSLASENAAGASSFDGYLSIFENIDPADVGRFLG